MSSTIRGSDNFDSLLSAVKDQDLSSDGYVEFGNGLIIQWQIGSATSGGTLNNFPIPYPTAMLGAACLDRTTGAAEAISIDTAITTTSFTLYSATASSSAFVISVGH